MKPESSTDADPAVAFAGFRPVTPFILPRERRSDPNDFGIFGLKMDLAAIATVVTGGSGFLHLPRLVEIFGVFIRDGADGAYGQAVATEFASQRLVALRHDLVEAALFHELQGVDHQDVFADVDAFGAGDAAIHVEVEHQAARVFGDELLFSIGEVRHAMLKGHVLQLAMSVGVADGTVQRMDGEVLFHGFFPSRKQIVAFGADNHAGCGLGGARPDRCLFSFLHDQAHAAGSKRIERIVVTHGRNDLAGAGNHIVERDAVLGRNRSSIDGQFNRGGFDVWIGRWFQTHEITSSQK